MRNYRIIILPQPLDAAKYIADEFLAFGSQNGLSNKGFHISLSGGNTPIILFRLMARQPYCSGVLWSKLHFWWVDERCVPPGDPRSNYVAAYEQLFRHIKIPAENLHRIIGEDDPQLAADHYREELESKVPAEGGLPVFDWTLLGLGDDGHTASLFPGGVDLGIPDITAVARHPESGQKRVTMSAGVLCASRRITFLVTGEKKSRKVRDILKKEPPASTYPAFHIKSLMGTTEWVLDEDAAKLLN